MVFPIYMDSDNLFLHVFHLTCTIILRSVGQVNPATIKKAFNLRIYCKLESVLHLWKFRISTHGDSRR